MSASNVEHDRSSNHDVIVIGGGVIGCFTAVYLLNRGRRVTLVERDTIGSGASMGNCGYVCPSHLMPLCGPGVIRHSLPGLLTRRGALSIPLRYDPSLWKWLVHFALKCSAAHQSRAALARQSLLEHSISLYRDFLAESGIACQWQDGGLLIVHRSPRTFETFAATAERLANEFAISPQSYAGGALGALEPALVDGLAGGWYFPDDAHLHPGELMSGLATHIRKLGGNILEGVEVNEIVVGRNRVDHLNTTHGTMRADQYVVTTGAEAPKFAKPLGCKIPIVPGKGYSMNFPNSASTPVIPMIFEDSHVAVTPLGNELRIGSTMQLTGYDRTIDHDRVMMIRDDAQGYLRTPLPAAPCSSWTGWRPMMADDLPCIDQVPAASNAFVASGNGMIGISTATATGKLISNLVCGEEPFIDPTPFSLSRFLSRRP